MCTSYTKYQEGLKTGITSLDYCRGLRSLALPRYLIAALEEQMSDTPFRDVEVYLTHLLTQMVEEEPAFALSSDDTEAVKARLCDLGYLE